MIANYQRDGFMQADANGGEFPNYRPNSFDDIAADENYREPATQLESNMTDWFDRNENDDDHFKQPGLLYRNVMNDQDRKNLINNIVISMTTISGDKKDEIIDRQLCLFSRVDLQLGTAIAKGLGVNIDKKAVSHII